MLYCIYVLHRTCVALGPLDPFLSGRSLHSSALHGTVSSLTTETAVSSDLTLLHALQHWNNEQDKRIDIAASSGNKTFIHWSSTGVEGQEGPRTAMYGLDVIIFNDVGKIKEVLVLRQPLESQKAELFNKEE